ncbi:MAG: ATP-binding protein [Clostridiales Family XIII bacterium]|jgi:predicted AAA+ superfamily ATPase|nr:ATP-binding protein [Clostridiales Family XIII bacterium]
MTRLLRTLLVYRSLGEDALVGKAARVFDGFGRPAGLSASHGDADEGDSRAIYYEVQASLLDMEADSDSEGTRWEDYVCRLVAGSVNVFSRQADRGEEDGAVAALAVREMRAMKLLYALDWAAAAAIVGDEASCVARMPARPGAPEGNAGFFLGKMAAVHRALRTDSDEDAALGLADYYRRQGRGMFQRYKAFCWDGGLRGIDRVDPVTFGDLVGYEAQKEKIIGNTEAFLKGLPRMNMLLHGDRGTGKSSCVKALLNSFAHRKLRLVETPKERAPELAELMGALAGQGCRFIVFIDDLSFEENETGYKALKSALEGGAAPQPANVMVCVTSNRRNIIKEVWRDRDGREDMHVGDAIQEKRSLADRFGMTVAFPAPDKKEYLEIVRAIAAREGLGVDEESLARDAMAWEIRGGGRSGRAARQFVDFIKRGL